MTKWLWIFVEKRPRKIVVWFLSYQITVIPNCSEVSNHTCKLGAISMMCVFISSNIHLHRHLQRKTGSSVLRLGIYQICKIMPESFLCVGKGVFWLLYSTLCCKIKKIFYNKMFWKKKMVVFNF